MGCHKLGLQFTLYTKTKLRALRDSEWTKVASCSKMQLTSWAIGPRLAFNSCSAGWDQPHGRKLSARNNLGFMFWCEAKVDP